MNNLKIVDLFSGCGGSALGFRNQGFQISVAVDIDRAASESFKVNFPEAFVFTEDISKLSGKKIMNAGKINNGNEVVLIACPPCQGFSSARRKSERKADPRNKLIYEFLRVVKEIRPIAFVMENVPGLAKGIGKQFFDDILDELHNLGYQTEHEIVNAADYGIPQRRKRLLLLGINKKYGTINFPKKTNSQKSTELEPWVSVRSAISDLPKISAGEKSISDQMHTSAHLSEKNLKRIMSTPRNGGSRNSWPEELILECHKNSNGYKDVYGRMKWDEPSPTITGGCAMLSKGRYGHPEQNRAISLREAARLQTFPDSFIFMGNFGNIAKQIGNAVPTLLAERAAKEITKALKSQTKQNTEGITY